MIADIRSMHETISSADMQEEKVRLLLRQTPSFSHASIVFAVTIFGLFTWRQHSPWLSAWLAGTVSVILFLQYLQHRYGLKNSESTRVESLSRRFHQALFASGATWGLLPAAIGPNSSSPDTISLGAVFVVALAANHLLGQAGSHFRAFLVGLTVSVTITLIITNGIIQALPPIVLILTASALLLMNARRSGEREEQALKQASETGQLKEDLQEALTALEKQQQMDLQEESIARHVFQQLTLRSDHDLPGISTWNEPMGKLSGDLIQITRGPDSHIYAFLGDFTGHGLPAALGAVPASTIFQTMVSKGLETSMIAEELNSKLHVLLPIGYFCCAAIMKFSADRRHFTLWHGGLPPILISRRQTGSIEKIQSDNLPLGVLDEQGFCNKCSTWDLEEGDRVLVYSDGLTEAEDMNGEMWGKNRLVQSLSENITDCAMIEHLKVEILEFTHLAPPSDDLSVIEIVAGQPCADRKVA